MSFALRFDHIGIAVRDLDAARRSYEELFGYTPLSGPFDDPVQQARVLFLADPRLAVGDGNGSSDVVLELVAPLDETSHVARLVDSGVGAYHVCYRVEDLGAALEEFRGKGCLIVKQPAPAVAYGGRRIAWLYLPTRQLVELVEQAPEDDGAPTEGAAGGGA